MAETPMKAHSTGVTTPAYEYAFPSGAGGRRNTQRYGLRHIPRS